MRPELLAVRAVNQYRRRDILAYLGLRYYLENHCAQSNMWAREVSTHLVNTRVSPVYFHSYHFKEMTENGSVLYRDIFVPGPNEALAEATLLNECSVYPAFKSLPCVYSYHFPKPSSKEGVFRNYFPGFRKRHNSIANYCRKLSGAGVLYTDIKKFYPTISKQLASTVWESACDSSDISSASRELGERLLSEYTDTAIAHNERAGVLTGPMFSHLIANLVLAEVDRIMSEKMKGKYWRYVDDIVLVGDVDQVKNGRSLLSSILSDRGFSLHEQSKDFVVDSTVWLEGENDFDDSKNKAWISLIANIKCFLIAKPEEKIDLERAFSENGINIPLLDYSNAVAESTYLEKLSDRLARHRWLARSVRTLSVKGLVIDAIRDRYIYENGMKALIDKDPDIKGYERKRLISKLRFYAGRLFYLSTSDVLSSVSSVLANYPELLPQSMVMSAIQSRDVSSLLRFGTNVVQAVAQILRIHSDSVKCLLTSFGEIELQGLAILRLNGIEVGLTDSVIGQTITDPLNQFALGHNPVELMKSDDQFIREIACLRGIEKPLRHKSMLDTAFDRDEQLIFDMISQLHESSYF